MAVDNRLALPTGYLLEGKYIVEKVLGAGGFGITYVARHAKMEGRRFAVKEFLLAGQTTRGHNFEVVPIAQDNVEDFEWGLKAFVTEASILAEVSRESHPNVVRVDDYFEANGTAYIVMDYIEGFELRRVFKERGPLPVAEWKVYLDQIVSGLRMFHEMNPPRLHRDVKPENILVRKNGSPVLIDFGAAREVTQNASKLSRAIVTTGYSPIEQWGDRTTQGPWTDIYALGALTYQALFGVIPTDAINRSNGGKLTPASRLGRETEHQTFYRAVDWALMVPYRDRPTSLDEWMAALEGRIPVPDYVDSGGTRPIEENLEDHEESEWAVAEAEGTVSAYDRFVQRYPNSKFAPTARDRSAWGMAIHRDSARGYQEYLALHPDGDYVVEGRSKISQIRAQIPVEQLDDFDTELESVSQAVSQAVSISKSRRPSGLSQPKRPSGSRPVASAGGRVTDPRKKKKSHVGALVAGLVVAATVGGGAYAAIANPDLINQLYQGAANLFQRDTLELADADSPAIGPPPSPAPVMTNEVAVVDTLSGPAATGDAALVAAATPMPSTQPGAAEGAQAGARTGTQGQSSPAPDGAAAPSDATPPRAQTPPAPALTSMEISRERDWAALQRPGGATREGLLSYRESYPTSRVEEVENTLAVLANAALGTTGRTDPEAWLIDWAEYATATDVAAAKNLIVQRGWSARLSDAMRGGRVALEALVADNPALPSDIAAAVNAELVRLKAADQTRFSQAVAAARAGSTTPRPLDAYIAVPGGWFIEDARREIRALADACYQRVLTSRRKADGDYCISTFPLSQAQVSAIRAATPTYVAGQIIRDCDGCPELVVLPKGSFSMGSNDSGSPSNERPVRRVSIDYLIAVGKFEVTGAEYQRCVDARKCSSPGRNSGTRPVTSIDFNAAVAYANWLSSETGSTYRLLSEAEWEYAARAGSSDKFPWGNSIGTGNANCIGCGSRWDNTGPAPAGSTPKNSFGLHEMIGNVWEWTLDCYESTYQRGQYSDGRAHTKSGCRRVLRGGASNSIVDYVRSAYRRDDDAGARNITYGFRVAKVLDQQ